MKSGNGTRGEHRSSAALIVSILALVVATGGTAVAVEGLSSSEKQTVQKIADKRVSGHVKPVFKRINDGQAGALVTKGAGFEIRANCNGSQVNAYLVVPVGTTADGVSDVDSVFGHQSPLDLNSAGSSSNQVSSFSIATKDGRVMSGDLGFDFPLIFNNQDQCVVYGHVLVN